MPRLRLTVAYDGTEFAGWQLQPAGFGRTVQGCLEEVLGRMCDRPVRVLGAGRTDSGVHALGQVAHCDVPESRAGLSWQKSLNSLLPKDISILDAVETDPDFHSRFDAVGKEYRYTLWTSRHFVLPWRRPYVWDVGRSWPLDVAAMDACAALFAGCHDFAAFQNVGTVVQSSVRQVHGVVRLPQAAEHEQVWQFRAEGFLKQMVRNLMGALVAVGRGKVSPEAIRSVLTKGQRSLAPGTAPACGLCLYAVEYASDGRGHKRHLFHQPEAGQG